MLLWRFGNVLLSVGLISEFERVIALESYSWTHLTCTRNPKKSGTPKYPISKRRAVFLRLNRDEAFKADLGDLPLGAQNAPVAKR